MIKVIILICFMLLSIGFIYFELNEEDNVLEDAERLYQGPVPEGYDKDYFRQTGITKPIK